MNNLLAALDWQKMQGLIPAIVQDVSTRQVLMLGYMNEASMQQTLETKKITFYSRSKKRLWVKGESSGNYLTLCELQFDCDQDAILILAKPQGPTCHLGQFSCFGEKVAKQPDLIEQLEQVILQRKIDKPDESYVASLFNRGIAKIAQKVGEEGVEVALAAVVENNTQVCEEVADLFFHVLVMLSARELRFKDVLAVLERRSGPALT